MICYLLLRSFAVFSPSHRCQMWGTFYFSPLCRIVPEFFGNKRQYSHLSTIPFVFKAWSKDQVPHRLHAKYGAEEKAAGRVAGFSQRRTCQVACSRYEVGSYGPHFFYQLYLRKFSFGQKHCTYSSPGTVAAFDCSALFYFRHMCIPIVIEIWWNRWDLSSFI